MTTVMLMNNWTLKEQIDVHSILNAKELENALDLVGAEEKVVVMIAQLDQPDVTVTEIQTEKLLIQNSLIR